MLAKALERIVLRNFKSFEELDLSLRPINILIGSNGSGKSNLISVFQMLRYVLDKKFQQFVIKSGGPDFLLYYGGKTSEYIDIELWFHGEEEGIKNGYHCKLIPARGSLLFQEEDALFHDTKRYSSPYSVPLITQPSLESELTGYRETRIPDYVLEVIRSWRVYHFHDTSERAPVRVGCDINDNQFLRENASNLAAYLYMLKRNYPESYQRILDTVQLVAPFIHDFELRPHPDNPRMIRLEWYEKESDLLFQPEDLSDGTLRFICLATLFLQPQEKLPTTIILDEPELGLHPFAIRLLAEMIKAVSEHTQVIIATHSVNLVNQFSPEDILVVDRVYDRITRRYKSVIRRLDENELRSWLEEFTLGELWEKNVFGGNP